MSELLNLKHQNNEYAIRTEDLEGRRHIVVPVVMLVEGVHAGSQGAIYHDPQQFGRIPDSWNGIPVTAQHPQRNGAFVPANDPGVLEEFRVGQIFHSQMSDGKLKAEAWLDEERLAEVSPQALGYIRQARPLEVSTGVFTEDQVSSGQWNGEDYRAIATNYRPDHLALLPGGQGACSWTDGCGVRANQGGDSIGMDKKKVVEHRKALAVNGYSVVLVNEQDFGDIMNQIQRKLDAMDDDVKIHWLQRTFDDNFIYEVGRMDGGESQLFRRSYTVSEEDGSVEFTGEPEQVIENREFVTVNQGGDTQMTEPCCKEKVEMVLQMDHLHFNEADRDHLNTLEEARIDELLAVEEPQVPEDVQINEDQIQNAIEERFKTTDQVLSILPPEMREQMSSGLKLHEGRRTHLITHILANTDEGLFTEDSLKAKSMDDLEMLGKMAKAPVDYTVQSASNVEVQNNTSPDEVLTTAGITLQ